MLSSLLIIVSLLLLTLTNHSIITISCLFRLTISQLWNRNYRLQHLLKMMRTRFVASECQKNCACCILPSTTNIIKIHHYILTADHSMKISYIFQAMSNRRLMTVVTLFSGWNQTSIRSVLWVSGESQFNRSGQYIFGSALPRRKVGLPYANY